MWFGIQVRNSFMSGSWNISLAVAAAAILVLYFLPSPIDPVPYRFNGSLPHLVGQLTPNTDLQATVQLFPGQVIGPESFAADQSGTIYTGGADGKIWAFKDDNLRLVTRTGKDLPDCGCYELEPECGRPKGMRVDSEGRLVVVDAYKGLLRVNTTSGHTEVLIPGSKGYQGHPFRFLNGLDITEDGVIYFTDSTTKWDRRDYRYEVLEANDLGRVLKYDPVTMATESVLTGLFLANGIALSADNSYFLVAEMTVCRIRKYYVKGPKAGQSEVVVDNLPGYPDNIKRNSRGNFYVGLGSVRFHGASIFGSFLDLVGPYPGLKRLIAKITPLQLYDVFLPKHALLLEISGEGKILASHHDPGAKVLQALSEGFEHNNKLYIGHFKIPFIGVLDMQVLKQRWGKPTQQTTP